MGNPNTYYLVTVAAMLTVAAARAAAKPLYKALMRLIKAFIARIRGMMASVILWALRGESTGGNG